MSLKNRNRLIAGSAAILGLSSKLYRGQDWQTVYGCGWDLLAPIFLYNLFYNDIKSDIARAGMVFGGLSAIEFSQYLGLYGTYAEKDFLAYGIGTAAALGIDKLTKLFSKSNR
jgi:hypothetical protein